MGSAKRREVGVKKGKKRSKVMQSQISHYRVRFDRNFKENNNNNSTSAAASKRSRLYRDREGVRLGADGRQIVVKGT